MATAKIHYFQSAVADANFRTIQGARDARLRVDVLTVDGPAPAAPIGSVFALIETDTNVRYTSTPKSVEVGGLGLLSDGTSTTPDDTSLGFPAAPFVTQGPISAEGGDVIRIVFG